MPQHIDIGNSKIAFFSRRSDGGWNQKRVQLPVSDESLRTVIQSLPNEENFSNYFSSDATNAVSIKKHPWMICSVNPNVEAQLKSVMDPLSKIHTVSWKDPWSFRFEKGDPSQIGADRLVLMEGALERVGAPVIVVSAGTATTVSVVGRDRVFLGGMIAPGLEALIQAASFPAQLFRVDLTPKVQEKALGLSTEEALQSGIRNGYLGLVHRLITQTQRALNDQASVVITGGAAPILEPVIESEWVCDPFVLAEGMEKLYGSLCSL